MTSNTTLWIKQQNFSGDALILLSYVPDFHHKFIRPEVAFDFSQTLTPVFSALFICEYLM